MKKILCVVLFIYFFKRILKYTFNMNKFNYNNIYQKKKKSNFYLLIH